MMSGNMDCMLYQAGFKREQFQEEARKARLARQVRSKTGDPANNSSLAGLRRRWQLEILQAVKRGDLSIEEGLLSLNRLENA